MMIMNIREENNVEKVNTERRFQQLLRAKHAKFDAQSALIGQMQKKLSTIDKTLRSYIHSQVGRAKSPLKG